MPTKNTNSCWKPVDTLPYKSIFNVHATTCWNIIKQKSEGLKIPSIFHCSNSGIASWYDLAVATTQISAEMGLISNPSTIIPIKSNQFITKAKRPSFSVLDCAESFLALSQKPIHWRTELEKLILDKSRRKKAG